jgi:large subunit ribosomal protein L29
MKAIVARELQKMNTDELDRRAEELSAELTDLPARVEEARQDLFNLKFRLATRQLDDTSQLRKTRKHIARLKTEETEIRQELALIDDIRRERVG